MTVSSISSGTAPAATDRKDLREAAQAFEAIFVRRLLASARAGSIADQTPFSGPGLEQFTAMRDEHVADVASRNGGFGLAAQIERQLGAMLRQQEGG
ncbi:MAG: rod-binding protein [Sphingomonadaceae bacterium]|nr:rod-binding protein [Sphingomonadaceae bacterium]